jgi:hypothetical protein
VPAYDALNLNALNTAEVISGGRIRLSADLTIAPEWVHPDWLRRDYDWKYFKLSYEGGRAYIESKNPLMLFSHERESATSYADRCRRAYYRNHCATIIGIKADAIYQPQVLRNQGKAERPEAETDTLTPATQDPAQPMPRIKRAQVEDPTFDDWVLNVDGRGTNADPFWAETSRWSQVYGVEWVGIAMSDAPMLSARLAAESRMPTVAEALAADLRTYLYRCPPMSVINWSTDQRGRLEWVVVLAREETRTPLPKQNAEKPKPKWIARVLYPDHEDRFLIGPNGGQTPVGSFPHKFGEVPLIPVAIAEDCKSGIEDIARINNDVFNSDSRVQEQQFRQCFNQLVAAVGSREAFMDNVTGTDSLLCVERGDTVQYLTPSVDTIKTEQDRSIELIDDMYGLAALRTRPGTKGQQPASDTSGVAYAFEHKQSETHLAALAKRLEEAESKLLKMRARAMGLDEGGVVVQYPQEFDIRAIAARINEAKEVANLGLGPVAEAENLKNVVRKLLPRLPAGKLQTIDAQIEEGARARAARAAAPPVPPAGAPPKPPDQSMQPPGTGAGEARTERPPPEPPRPAQPSSPAPPPPKIRARRPAA